ncbi:aldehyde dehydrogenase family protein [Nocardia sp. CA-135953]|uniref:aldehyde dehydrogenase family protein n=1 Tax=Nocardia sp. CA-135953 TaxID=3239978 RepID=UPI003D98CB9C
MSIIDSHSKLAARVLPEPALYIGSERVTRTSRGTLDRVDPTTGQVLGSFPVAGSEEVDRAVAAGRRAFPSWKRLGADQRRRILWRIAEQLRAHEDELIQLVALETGTPLTPGYLGQAIDLFEYYAGWSDKFEGELISAYPARALDYVRYEPYGVVGALITWNGPIINASMKLAPALAAGNCVVMRSPELGPFAVMRLAELCLEAGLPEGVLSVLSGDRYTSEAIIRHPDVRKVSFTGSPQVATSVMALAAETQTPVTLELGGKSANIVFADADLDAAAQMAAFMSTIAGAGQGCFFPTRLMVESSVYDEVLERVQAVAQSPRIGDPLDPAVTMGPVIDHAAAERILAVVDQAKSEARLVTGGDRLDGELASGAFVRPTVLADVDNASSLAQQEVFGPVLAVTRFDTAEQALEMANATSYGLAAYVHTTDLVRAHRMAEELEVGWVAVNSFAPMTASAPFGGTKASGFGREGGRAAIEDYVHHKNVYIPLS